MLFNSIAFLYGFLPLVYLVFWKLKTRDQRYIWLTLSGYVFYSFWDYRFCALMAFSTLVSYGAGLGMLKWDQRPARRRLCLVVPITLDLLLLGFFKYTGLLLDSARSLSQLLGVNASVPAFHVILPIGISFYTFHTITYIADSYRRVIKPTRNVFEFACYVSLFCQLVAGPIVRFRQIEDDLESIDSKSRTALWNRGWSFFAVGMVKKVLVADTIAAIIDPALAHYQTLSTITTWGVMLGYSFQLYFDFSGYSDMAVGLGSLFGLSIPQNFNSPYKAADPSDFWRRWHISLSTCLRDYLYIPLGGNRRYPYRNVLLTMLIGGIWHGPSWTFLAWGGYHGLLLLLYRRWGRRTWDELPLLARQLGTFVLVLIGWVAFRAASFRMTAGLLGKMFRWTKGSPIPGGTTLWLMILLCCFIVWKAKNTFEMTHDWAPWQAVALTAGFAASLALIHAGHLSPFLYFQF